MFYCELNVILNNYSSIFYDVLLVARHNTRYQRKLNSLNIDSVCLCARVELFFYFQLQLNYFPLKCFALSLRGDFRLLSNNWMKRKIHWHTIECRLTGNKQQCEKNEKWKCRKRKKCFHLLRCASTNIKLKLFHCFYAFLFHLPTENSFIFLFLSLFFSFSLLLFPRNTSEIDGEAAQKFRQIEPKLTCQQRDCETEFCFASFLHIQKDLLSNEFASVIHFYGCLSHERHTGASFEAVNSERLPVFFSLYFSVFIWIWVYWRCQHCVRPFTKSH